ncbi:MAG TPA: hypothetical protein VGQ53_25485 [Chitinophagaceae bacterium]|jgi:hypothetical protein|nr:hypothetical protein [Chitinophagaceae bacterium]
MRILPATLSAVTILLFSCEKERDSASRQNSNTDATGTRLVKMVTKNGIDSAVHIYSYNSSGKLVDMTATGTDQGDVLFNEETIVRNSEGIIQKIIFKDEKLTQSGTDSFLINVYYDQSLSQYTSRVDRIDYGSVIWRDSVTFSYDANGKMVTLTYFTDNGSGTYHPGGKADYTYAGNNMASVKLFSYNSGAYEEDFTVTNEFDTKPSPLILGNEAFVIDYQGLGAYYSANNFTKQTATYPSDPTETYTFTNTYNSTGLPATSIARLEPGNDTYTFTYFYQ